MAYTAGMKRFRHITVLLLLLAYAGQSMAMLATPCFMMGVASTAISSDMAGMDHSGHDMALVDHDMGPGDTTASDGNCCESGGFCSINHCQSMAALTDLTAFDANIFAPARRDAVPSSSLNLSLVSLYRPPITR